MVRSTRGAAGQLGAKSITDNPISINKLPTTKGRSSITPSKQQMPLFVTKEKEIDGVGMGVLSDGTAFLTGRGLARLCEISNARIVEMGQNWKVTTNHAMTEGVKKILQEKGLMPDEPYVAISRGGRRL